MKKIKNDIKGVLKVLFYLLLIAAAVGGTCYMFFRYLNEQKYCYDEVSAYVYSVERDEFLSDVTEINSPQNSGGRLDTLIKGLNGANKVAKTLAPYLITCDVDDDLIIKRLDAVKVAEQNCIVEINNYVERMKDLSFNRTDVNKLYTAFSNYLVSYSNMISTVNAQIEAHSKYKLVDIKFSVIDSYARVLNSTFSSLNTDGEVVVKSTKNLDVFDAIKYDGVNIKLKNEDYVAVNQFITNYNACDKAAFATNLADNLKTYGTYNDSYTDLQKANYYFNVVFVKEVA